MGEKKYSCEEILGGDNIYHRSKGVEEKPSSFSGPFNGAIVLIENRIGRKLFPEEKATIKLEKVDPPRNVKKYIRTLPSYPLPVIVTDPKPCCSKGADFISEIIEDPEEVVGPEELEDIKITTTFDYKCHRCYDDEQINRIIDRATRNALYKYRSYYNVRNHILRLYHSGQYIKLLKYIRHPIPIKPINQKVYRSDTPADKITEPVEKTRFYTAFWDCEEGNTQPCCSSSSSIECEENPLPSTWDTDDIDKKIPCLQNVYSTVEGCNCIWHEACDTAYYACLNTSPALLSLNDLNDILDSLKKDIEILST